MAEAVVLEVLLLLDNPGLDGLAHALQDVIHLRVFPPDSAVVLGPLPLPVKAELAMQTGLLREGTQSQH